MARPASEALTKESGAYGAQEARHDRIRQIGHDHSELLPQEFRKFVEC